MPRSTDENSDQRPVVTIANQNRSVFVDPFTFHLEITIILLCTDLLKYFIGTENTNVGHTRAVRIRHLPSGISQKHVQTCSCSNSMKCERLKISVVKTHRYNRERKVIKPLKNQRRQWSIRSIHLN